MPSGGIISVDIIVCPLDILSMPSGGIISVDIIHYDLLEINFVVVKDKKS